MNPVQALIREHVERHHADWLRNRATSSPTRAGERYSGESVARLLAPPLEAVGLAVEENEGIGRRFRTTTGRHVTRAALADLLDGALAGHPDAVLRESLTSDAFFLHLGDRMPFHAETDEEPDDQADDEQAATAWLSDAAWRARRWLAETESSRAWLRAALARHGGTSVQGSDLYAAACDEIADRALGGELVYDHDDAPTWTIPRRRVFYEVARQEYGPARRGKRGMRYAVPSEPVVTPQLGSDAAEALRVSGVERPEEHADSITALIAEPAPAAEPSPLVEAADALPFGVAAGMASSEVPRRALGLLGRLHVERHPGDAAPIRAAARLFADGLGDDLTEAVRRRVALALDAENAPRT